MIDRNSPVTEEDLHAYVDGEVVPERRPVIEAWLAAHPEDAARVATWRAQADAIRARYGALATDPVPPRRLGQLGSIYLTHPSVSNFNVTRAELLQSADEVFGLVAAGTIKVEIGDPIMPGLDKQAFFARVQNDIETATARLVADARRAGTGKPD